MKRLLCIVSAMNAGGAETFLMKIYRCLDRSRYQMDFCVNVETEGLYDEEIQSMGGKIYRIPSKSESINEFSKNLYRVVNDNGYKNVLRITSNAMGFYDLYIAKKAGAVNCIARSSNSSDGGGLKAWIAHRAGKLLYKRFIDVEIAPSDLAAIYTFGEKDYKSGKVRILNNGINFDEYRFSSESRKRIRAEFGIEDNCFLIGHIGRFTEQKNHEFLLEVFSEASKKRKNLKLLLAGDGELTDPVRQKCTALGVEENVIFAGIRRDIPAILSAMDLFVFPSLYEGMPNVVIEAQASGLRCLISDRITREVIITSLAKMLTIDDTDVWASAVVNEDDAWKQRRSSRAECVLPQEYDIKNVCNVLTSILI